jgi:asparagine synthase (glutamine-hydrolysing)
VIVHAFEEWGTECFAKMNGQWALALWDERRKRLTLARDRMGIRPLYYAEHVGRFRFASEAKALFADPAVPRGPDPVGLKQTFTFWSPVPPRTVFAGIGQLRPGHYAVLEAGRPGAELQCRPYWQPAFAPTHGSGAPAAATEAENAAALRERLVQASQLRFTRSDVPVGAYLSGGLDSSLISAMVSRYTETPLKTFSLCFEEAEFDESRYQRMMAQRLGTDHESLVVSRREIGGVLPEVIWHAERPLLRSAPAPLFLLSKLVREAGYKVVVTGEGSDEVLAGYDIFREGKVREFMARDAQSSVRAGILHRLYPWMEQAPGRAPAFAKAFFGRNMDAADPAISHRPRWDSTSVIQQMLLPEALDGAREIDVAAELVSHLPASASDWDSLGRAQWLEMVTLLEGYILSAQGDRMLMSHSVEGRFPFLDPGVVELAGRLPARHKLMGLDEKHVLKVASRDLVPPEILGRPKQPYRAPDAASLIGDAAPDYLADVLSEGRLREAGLFAPAAVERLIRKAERRGSASLGNTDNMRIVAVVSTMLWYERFIAAGALDSGNPPEPLTVIDRTGVS